MKDPVEEASYVVEQIKKQMETGILAEEIAVLFRVHTDARAVVEALIDEKIPFQMREHLPNLYNHFIAKDIMAYFRLAMGQRERKDFLQVMNRPKRYLGRDCSLEEWFLLRRCTNSIVIKSGCRTGSTSLNGI